MAEKERNVNSFSKKSLIVFLLYFLFSFGAALSCFGLSAFQYDRLAFDINNYNKTTIANNDFHPTIININSDDVEDNYSKLLNYYYYNSLNSGVRILAENKTELGGYDIKILSQDTFSIKSNEQSDGGYYIDKGLYYAYFSDEVLGNRGYLNFRYNCDTFIFITDSFANKLLNHYGLENNIESYKTLIKDEEYCVLNLSIDNGQSLKVCINNIIYTNKRQAPRTEELYGDFGLIYNRRIFNDYLDFAFEIDLKDNPYCIRETFESLNRNGYNASQTNISFKTFNLNNHKYETNSKLTSKYLKIKSNLDILFYVVFVLVLLIGLALIIWQSIKHRSSYKVLSIGVSLIFVIYGIVSSFVYIFPLFSIAPLVYLLTLFIIFGKELKDDLTFCFIGKSNPIVKKTFCQFYEIKI